MKSVLRYVCILGLFGAVSAKGAVVYFADQNLKAAIENALNIWDPTEDDLRWETRFDLRYEGIKDLTGIEAAVNLQHLNLRGNQVKDVSPLQALTQLTGLDLSENELNDLSGVATLTQLRSLDAHGNGVTDLSPLSGMTQLVSLTVRDNNFQGNLSALSSLTGLESLDLQENHISSLRDLRGLTSLRHLSLADNFVSEVADLANMTELETLDLRYNILSDISGLRHLTHLTQLFLQSNPLSSQAYSDLQTIHDNNHNIDLRYDPRSTPPSSVQATRGTQPDRVNVIWQAVANGPSYASYYRVHRAVSLDIAGQAVSAWQTATSFSDTTAMPGTHYTYWVQTALSDSGLDAGDLSTPVQGWRGQGMEQASVLSMGPSVGALVSPESGIHAFEKGALVDISTQSLDPNLFVFTGWAGSAVDNGRVSDPNQPFTSVLMDANDSLVALYRTT
ncbi:MAG: leucine-rich repeat domain-containing protein, partial [Phycisphaerae bacterium]|nr:leucine-rich repeat domain-containing protein [Phycisphaerae bacterium]